jgi:glycosyltransferase involved in cell wall biosynthesis
MDVFAGETMIAAPHDCRVSCDGWWRSRQAMSDKIEISFVVPLYNEQEVFDTLVQRLVQTLAAAPFSCEVILVDDGSTDGTRARIERICDEDPRFRGVLLSRNFGHQRAVSAGLDHARGSCVGILDGDLQDPPETLLEFHRKLLEEDYDVVYGVRQRRKEWLLKRFCYWAFYRLLRRMATIDIPLDAGDFCLMRRRVVDSIANMPERHRFLRGMRSWVGMRQVGVEYDRPARAAGTPKYSFSKLMLLAVDGLLTFSEAPLRIATWFGALVAAAAFGWSVYIVCWRLFGDASELAGFATLACGMFFLGGIQLICLGILGEYVARVHNEVKGRPIYIVDRRFGFDATDETATSTERAKVGN